MRTAFPLTKILKRDAEIAQRFRPFARGALARPLEELILRLLAKVPADRYQSAEELQQFSGVAPVTESSGKTHWVHWRMACPKFLRQTFHEFAAHSIGQSQWARAFYQMQRDKGKKHHAAVRSLAFKWIRVLYRCWKNRTPYDEQLYWQSLQKRNSPLKALLPGTAWKDVAGYRDPQNEVEKPHGQWNCLELWAVGDNVRYYVNHKLVNEGTGASLTKGRLLFQSEGAEVYFKTIELRQVRKSSSK